MNLITSFWTLVLTVASSNVKIKLPRTCKVEYILIEGFIQTTDPLICSRRFDIIKVFDHLADH